MQLTAVCKRIIATDTCILILSALSVVALHTATNGRYGFHRDELATLDDARFLAWGYVVYPPVTPFLARVALALFGPSMIGLRFFGALAAGVAMVLTGLMAREIGGKRRAQLVAAWAAATAGPAVFLGSVFQYVSFDYLWWVLAAWIAFRLVQSEDQRWWLALGAAVGLGMMTKFTMAFFLAGIAGGIVLTKPRRLLNRWLWYGAAIAFLIFLPNLVWQIRNHFITLDFLKFIHARDVAQGSTNGFLPAQLWSVTNPVTAPLWIAGLYFLLIKPEGKRYRMIGWMYVIPLALLFIAKGKPYYLAPAYPMLLAAGAVWGERWSETLSPAAARTVRRVVGTSLVVSGIVVVLVVLPLAPPGSRWWRIADAANGNFNEEFGWPEMASAVVRVRDSLPRDSEPVGILAGDAGQAAAINLYGRGRGLPEVISGSNSHWLRGYGNPPPKTVVAAGFLRGDLETVFESCEAAGHFTIPFGIENIAIGAHTDIFVCRRPRQPWHVFWWQIHSFG
jgi:4-amino-4-deoxy-L-arabinose transferase-like glycosyltransferase